MNYYDVLFALLIVFGVFGLGVLCGWRYKGGSTIDIPIRIHREAEMRKCQEPPAHTPPENAVHHVHHVKFTDLTEVPAYSVMRAGITSRHNIGFTTDPEVARKYSGDPNNRVTVVPAFQTPDGRVLSLKDVELLPRIGVEEAP